MLSPEPVGVKLLRLLQIIFRYNLELSNCKLAIANAELKHMESVILHSTSTQLQHLDIRADTFDEDANPDDAWPMTMAQHQFDRAQFALIDRQRFHHGLTIRTSTVLLSLEMTIKCMKNF
jgi:hypothetical protein